MDGNRRYARNHKIETVEGHNLGFEALARILEVCYKSGVKVVTIYAFSIENFKRSRYEVDALMDMAKTKLTQLAQHGELLERYGARIQVLGQKELVRSDVLEAIDRAVDMTKDHKHAVLNVCFPYTSRNEITTAIRETVREFSQPLRPSIKRPFSESHIARNIRTRQLSSVSEERPSLPSQSSEDMAVDGDDTEVSTYSNTSTGDHPPSSRSSISSSPALKPKASTSNYPDPETITADTITAHTFTADAPRWIF
ncbi:cis-prenyltransferase [Taxawa tesnikishii (nom. ined.)]|nr:cis-prenyltransferase [Dothideales sp. JES 119]